MNRNFRGIECSLSNDAIYSFLRFITQGDYDYYAPWCLKNEEGKLLPQCSENIKVTSLKLQEFESQGLWELVLHIYPCGAEHTHIETYDDFVASSCVCCLIYYDCGFLDVYLKSQAYFQRMWDELISLSAEDMVVITDENDCRTALHL